MSARPNPGRWIAFAARLRRDRSAVAYLEFALSLPAVLGLFIGGSELANLAIVHTRLSQIASATADNAARVRDRIDEADINEIYFGMSKGDGSLNLLEHGRLIISSVEDNTATTTNLTDQKIVWQRCKGVKNAASSYGVEAQVLSQGIGAGTRRISATAGNPVIFVQLFYDYQPLFTNAIFGTQVITYSSAFSVRDRADNSIQNGGNLAGAAKATCNYFNAAV